MKRILLNISRYGVIATSLMVVAGCCCKQNTEWAGNCFAVYEPDPGPPPPAPHARIGYKFCIEKESNQWWFYPGYRMGHWEALTGGGQIPMNIVSEDEDSITWTVEADITNHTIGQNHPKEHQGEWKFTVEVTDYAKPNFTEASITGGGGPTGGTHGGSAHANVD